MTGNWEMGGFGNGLYMLTKKVLKRIDVCAVLQILDWKRFFFFVLTEPPCYFFFFYK